MAYQIQYFNDVRLPFYNPTQDHSPATANGTLLDSIGGSFDPYGDEDAPAARQNITITGVVFGETDYWVDEAGDYLVDEAGDYLIAGTPAQMLRSQLAALRAQVRKRGRLWRARLDDESVREWKTARFVRMGQPQVVTDRVSIATVACEFETGMEYWHAETETVKRATVANGVTAYMAVENPGEATIYDAVLQVTCTSGTITAITVRCAELGIKWVWSGSLSTGGVLVVDGRDEEKPAVATSAYTGYAAPDSDHTAAGWLPIEVGAWAFTVTVTGGDARAVLSFYPQSA